MFSATINQGIFDPFGFDIIERPFVVDIKDDDNCMRPIVIRLGDVLKSLLTGGIPNLKLDEVVFKVKGSLNDLKKGT